mmetsp:Transcript_12388/g.33277  ORF Transcript_12388/g.33277 Transcript_12388/m.33277 type:complete len:267 (+) Transcript_12388:556-1356(+)
MVPNACSPSRVPPANPMSSRAQRRQLRSTSTPCFPSKRNFTDWPSPESTAPRPCLSARLARCSYIVPTSCRSSPSAGSRAAEGQCSPWRGEPRVMWRKVAKPGPPPPSQATTKTRHSCSPKSWWWGISISRMTVLTSAIKGKMPPNSYLRHNSSLELSPRTASTTNPQNSLNRSSRGFRENTSSAASGFFRFCSRSSPDLCANVPIAASDFLRLRWLGADPPHPSCNGSSTSFWKNAPIAASDFRRLGWLGTDPPHPSCSGSSTNL